MLLQWSQKNTDIENSKGEKNESHLPIFLSWDWKSNIFFSIRVGCHIMSLQMLKININGFQYRLSCSHVAQQNVRCFDWWFICWWSAAHIHISVENCGLCSLGGSLVYYFHMFTKTQISKWDLNAQYTLANHICELTLAFEPVSCLRAVTHLAHRH